MHNPSFHNMVRQQNHSRTHRVSRAAQLRVAQSIGRSAISYRIAVPSARMLALDAARRQQLDKVQSSVLSSRRWRCDMDAREVGHDASALIRIAAR